jgi:hypothetical protein
LERIAQNTLNLDQNLTFIFNFMKKNVEEPASETKQTSATSKVVSDESVTSEHSLELVIMRDEIKDLRDRLDTSQKLIESLMERLANLAELALTSRNRD